MKKIDYNNSSERQANTGTHNSSSKQQTNASDNSSERQATTGNHDSSSERQTNASDYNSSSERQAQ